MLKRLKKSLSLTLVLALCMSFIACGSDGKSDDNFSDDSDSFEGRVRIQSRSQHRTIQMKA